MPFIFFFWPMCSGREGMVAVGALVSFLILEEEL